MMSKLSELLTAWMPLKHLTPVPLPIAPYAKAKWVAYRSALKAYAIRGAIGAALGAFYGYRVALREAHDTAVTLAAARPLATTVFGASVGCLAGLIFWRLRWMRERGGLYYFFSWGLSLGAAIALVMLPTTLKTREWLGYVIIVAVSVSAGGGLAAFFLLMTKDQHRQ